MDHLPSDNEPPSLELAVSGEFGSRTVVSLSFPEDLSFEEWEETGQKLNRAAGSLAWWVGDWWRFGEHKYGDRKAIVKADDWQGPSFQTCANAASVCKKFETSRRREALSFNHHAEVAALPPDEADALLDWCEEPIAEGGPPRSVRELREEKQRRAEEKRTPGDDDPSEQPAPSAKPRQKKAPSITLANLFPRSQEEPRDPTVPDDDNDRDAQLRHGWTDKEIEKAMGTPVATEEEVTRMKFLSLADVAQRIRNVNLSNVSFTQEMISECHKVIQTWTQVLQTEMLATSPDDEQKEALSNWLKAHYDWLTEFLKPGPQPAATPPQDPPKQDEPADVAQPADKVQQRFRTLPESRQVREDE
jgi:dsDNA-binding SOS-regulon protein